MMHAFEADKDNTKEKRERRLIEDELCARQPSFLATDYPGKTGRAFIRKLHKTRPDLEITLVNKANFHRDFPGDSLHKVVTKMPGLDIFDVIQYNKSSLVSIDLFGGLSEQMVEKLERAPYWKTLLLTFSNVWRHKSLPAALMSGEDPATFMELLCKRNNWKGRMAMLPYRHKNKRAIMGILDARGPKYWTFLIER